MSCGSCSEKTKAGASSAIGSPVATGGAANVRHCPQCGGFLPKDGQCRRCATIAERTRGVAGSGGANRPRNSQERYPFWVQRWRELGDDMPCPECGEEQLKTQDGLTVCRACNWRAENQLAIDEFGHGVTEAVSAQAAEVQDLDDEDIEQMPDAQTDADDVGDRLTISMWLPGGSMQPMTLAQAHQNARECWDTPQGFYWERRDEELKDLLGDDSGDLHEYKKYTRYTTMRDVVTAALPHWKELGLTPEQAGLIAMEAGVVWSTDVEIEDEEAEETD